jgi:hypothetical protein
VIGAFFDEHPGAIALIIIVVFFGLIAAGTYYSGREHDQTCDHLMSLAATRHDTLEVSIACEIKQETKTSYVPVYMPVER